MIFSRLLLQRSVACILLTAVSTGLAQTTATEYFNQAALKRTLEKIEKAKGAAEALAKKVLKEKQSKQTAKPAAAAKA